MSFIPKDNLDDLNEEQRKEYYLAACEFLGVPAELNLLKFFYADSSTGRNLILYATRGATDIIRENKGITVEDIQQHDGPGYVSFTCRGKSSNGRYEMATGATGTEGLKGERLAVAIMVAQTKALRRMTLQFAGGGFLDESELSSFESNIPASVNNTSGVDITSGVNITQPPTPIPKKRKPRNTVTLASPNQMTIPLGTIDAQGDIKPLDSPLDSVALTELKIQDIPSGKPEEISSSLPTPEQLKSYRDRLSVFANDVLPLQGKMIPTEGIGGVSMKLRLFAGRYLNLPDVMKASPELWEKLLTFLDITLANNGAVELVKIINETVEAR